MHILYGHKDVCSHIEAANRVWVSVCVSVCVCVWEGGVLWKCCSYWSGLSVTNEPSGTVTGMGAKDVPVCAWQQVAHRFVCPRCICVTLRACERYLVWPVGTRRLQAGDSTGLCCARANLLNSAARGGSRRGLVLSGCSAQQSKTHSTALCTSPLPPPTWNRMQVKRSRPLFFQSISMSA